ncbi:hypothetical protein PHJA_001056000 [Phtheirospermum japonicum]|uniref:Uncharacterized protein n=1 Tax=Phtheirospermum japonicum TaxID=374723 RepID=A0A830BZ74_9LAMI|nr:hypothetical protein PHJA_001056000 [Phtheirospermum japonicum]
MPPQESFSSSIFNSPNKNLRGLKGLIYNNSNAPYAEETINDHELAHRKAEEAVGVGRSACTKV